MAADLRRRVQSMQWQRGARALLAIGSAMTVCHVLGRVPGAAALGAFDALLVDNGGPYRSRLITMATVLTGGAAALIAGALVPQNMVIAVLATMAVCFAVTFSRVLSQPLASSSVLVLVLYFAGLGGLQHTWGGALVAAEMFLLGGLWALLISLVLWPFDPFRPARLAVAECYHSLAFFTGTAPGEGSLSAAAGEAERERSQRAAYEWRHRQRVLVERARTALGATAARAPSRTTRARNLAVLLETADMLMARQIRLTGLADLIRATTVAEGEAVNARLKGLILWLAAAEQAVASALVQRPADSASSFAREGSLWLEHVTRRRDEMRQFGDADSALAEHLRREERDALLEIEVAFDAVRALWTGSDARRMDTAPFEGDMAVEADARWLDALRGNWTMQSRMMRHALRVMIVGAIDVVVMRLIHVNHGFWLPVTSIVLLQPFSAGTTRKSMQRVVGTISGGFLAAVLAAAISSQLAMIAVITVLAAMAVATFAVDYAVYCFFLTPAFVLLSLPHAHDWRYAGIRIGTTLLGALISITAMRVLWPERAEEELSRLLDAGAQACADYLRALLRFWKVAARDAQARRTAEREILAPARRLCGLASNDAEEAVDRVMQEPRFGLNAERDVRLRDEALTFATYLRRMTQSITTLAAIGRDSAAVHARLERAAWQLQSIAQNSAQQDAPGPGERLTEPAEDDLAEEQMQRIERQVGVLARCAAALRTG